MHGNLKMAVESARGIMSDAAIHLVELIIGHEPVSEGMRADRDTSRSRVSAIAPVRLQVYMHSSIVGRQIDIGGTGSRGNNHVPELRNGIPADHAIINREILADRSVQFEVDLGGIC